MLNYKKEKNNYFGINQLKKQQRENNFYVNNNYENEEDDDEYNDDDDDDGKNWNKIKEQWDKIEEEKDESGSSNINFYTNSMTSSIQKIYGNKISFINNYLNFATTFTHNGNTINYNEENNIGKEIVNEISKKSKRISLDKDNKIVNDSGDACNMSIWQIAAEDLYLDVKNELNNDYIKLNCMRNIKHNKILNKEKNQDKKVTNRKRELIQSKNSGNNKYNNNIMLDDINKHTVVNKCLIKDQSNPFLDNITDIQDKISEHKSVDYKNSDVIEINSSESNNTTIYTNNIWQKAAKELYYKKSLQNLMNNPNFHSNKSNSSENYFSCCNQTSISDYNSTNASSMYNDKNFDLKNRISKDYFKDKLLNRYNNDINSKMIHRKRLTNLNRNNFSPLLSNNIVHNKYCKLFTEKRNNNNNNYYYRQRIEMEHDSPHQYRQNSQIYELNIKHNIDTDSETLLKEDISDLYLLKNNSTSKSDFKRKIITTKDKKLKIIRCKEIDSEIFFDVLDLNDEDLSSKTDQTVNSGTNVEIKSKILSNTSSNKSSIKGDYVNHSNNSLINCNNEDKKSQTILNGEHNSSSNISKRNSNNKINNTNNNKTLNIMSSVSNNKLSHDKTSLDLYDKKSINEKIINNKNNIIKNEKKLKSFSEQKFQLQQEHRKNINRRVMNAKQRNKIKRYNNPSTFISSSNNGYNQKNFSSKSDNVINKINDNIFLINCKQLTEENDLSEPVKKLNVNNNNNRINKNTEINNEICMLKKYTDKENFHNSLSFNKGENLTDIEHSNYSDYEILKWNNYYNTDLICNVSLSKNRKHQERSGKIFSHKVNQGDLFKPVKKRKVKHNNVNKLDKPSDEEESEQSDDESSRTKESENQSLKDIKSQKTDSINYYNENDIKIEKKSNIKEKESYESGKSKKENKHEQLFSKNCSRLSQDSKSTSSFSKKKDTIGTNNSEMIKQTSSYPKTKVPEIRSNDSSKKIVEIPSKIGYVEGRSPKRKSADKIDKSLKSKVNKHHLNIYQFQELLVDSVKDIKADEKKTCCQETELQRQNQTEDRITENGIKDCHTLSPKTSLPKIKPKDKDSFAKCVGFLCCCQPGECSIKETLKKMFCISLPSRTSSEAKEYPYKNEECDKFERLATFNYRGYNNNSAKSDNN